MAATTGAARRMSSGVGGMLRSPSGGEPVRTRSGSLDADARATWGALLARDAADWALVAAFFLFSVLCERASASARRCSG